MPGPRLAVCAPGERLEDALEVALGDARAAVDDAHDRLLRVVVTRTCTGSPGRRELERVLEQVDEHALDLAGVDLDDRSGVGRAARPSTRSADAARARRAPGDELVDAPSSSRCGRGGAGLEPREVEQVADQRARAGPPRAAPSRGAPARSLVVERERRADEALGGHADRRQRRAQVVADGAQDGGLDRVARRSASASSASRASRSRSMATASSEASAGRNRRRTAQVRRRALADVERADAAGRRRRARAATRRPAAPAAAEDEPRAAAPSTSATLGGDRVRSAATSPPGRSAVATPASRAASRSRCSASAARRRARAARSLTTIADDEVDGQREPVLAVAQRERVDRRQEEPVEGEHARQRHRDRVARPKTTATGSTAKR